MNQLPKEMLPELKVESFVTSLADEKLINLQGVEVDSEVPGCWTPLSWMDLCGTNTACSTTDLYPNTGCGC